MSHRRAVAAMVVATLLWSIAGVVSRQIETAGSFEATFWRSAFNAAALLLGLGLWRGPRALIGALRRGGTTLWLSALCWAVMFTAFMVAITMTTVANVLVTMAVAPLLTALFARVALGHRLPPRTWAAIAVAGCGIAWMYFRQLGVADARQLAGIAVAAAVPLAAASNWTLLQRSRTDALAPDMALAIALGALLSAVLVLPASLPFAASASDLGWLALLGVFQLAVPCLIAVAAARVLAAPEAALLSLLEIVFGVGWTWLARAEAPSVAALQGGALVIGALLANEALALRRGAGLRARVGQAAQSRST